MPVTQVEYKLLKQTSTALKASEKAIQKEKGKNRKVFEARLRQNVKVPYNNAMKLYQAVKAGKNIAAKSKEVKSLLNQGIVNSTTILRNKQLTDSIKKNSPLIKKVTEKQMRDGLSNYYMKTATKVNATASIAISIKDGINLFNKALKTNNTNTAIKQKTNIEKLFKEAKDKGLWKSQTKLYSLLNGSFGKLKNQFDQTILVSQSIIANRPTTFGGKIGQEKIYNQSIVIVAGKGKYIKLANAEVNGNIIIKGDSTGAGTVYLDNVKVNRVQCQGGSIIVEDVANSGLSLKSVIADSMRINDTNGANIVADKGTKVRCLHLAEKAGTNGLISIDSKEKGTFEQMEIASNEPGSRGGTTLSGELSESTVSVTGKNSMINFSKGLNLKQLNVTTSAILNSETGANIETVQLSPKAAIQRSATKFKGDFTKTTVYVKRSLSDLTVQNHTEIKLIVFETAGNLSAENGASIYKVQVAAKEKGGIMQLFGDLSRTLVQILNANSRIDVGANTEVMEMKKDPSVGETVTVINNGRILRATGLVVKNNPPVSTTPPMDSHPGEAPTIGSLTVSSVDDDDSDNQTIISVAGHRGTGNEYAYKVFDDVASANAGKPKLDDDVSGWTVLPVGGKIAVPNGKIVLVVERNATSYKAKKVGQTVAVTEVEPFNQPADLTEVVMLDGKDGVSPQDGEVETVRLKFNENIDPSTVSNNSFTVEGFDVLSIQATDKGGRIPGDAAYTNGELNYITIKVQPVPGTNFSPKVRQNPSITIKSASGTEYKKIYVQATDSAAPVIIGASFVDVNSNGVDRGDQIVITFSEDVNGIESDLVDDFILKENQDYSFDSTDSFKIENNVVTATLGITTAMKLAEKTNITIQSDSSKVSISDLGGNMAKPQKELNSSTKSVEIKDIPGKSEFAGGDGSVENPFIIMNAQQLDKVRKHLDAHYQIGDDIDLSEDPFDQGEGWVPIGDKTNRFTGSIDGNGKTIRNLIINRASQSQYTGLFGFIDGATIKNLKLDDINVTGWIQTGGLVGTAFSSTISDCSVSDARIHGDNFSGGFIGYVKDGSVNNIEIVGVNLSGGSQSGNLIGRLDNGQVSGITASNLTISGSTFNGGLIGYDQSSQISDVTASNINVKSQSDSGGILGQSIGSTIHTLDIKQVVIDASGYNQIGGVIGTAGNINLEDINIEGVNLNGANFAGGLIGTEDYTSTKTIINNVAAKDIKITITSQKAAGLIAEIDTPESQISNVVLDNVEISGDQYVGGLVSINKGKINNTSVHHGKISGSSINVGGLVALNYGVVRKSSVSDDSFIIGETNVGGLVGYNYLNASIIENCYSTAEVDASGVTSPSGIGGLVGKLDAKGTITNSYSTGKILGNKNLSVMGGLVGLNFRSEGIINSSFYDSDTTGFTGSDKGTPKTTLEMKDKDTFVDWDFTNIWEMNGSYPILR
ncbi:GLUG motif-containing protein [Bacillus massilinigeriensis]|uniref:GLUG motif-containing protein n=1 Tax=Bacillus massilionigeriensis TaxID=1805475 RepID=UPI00096B4A6E|nr:GLUG motif-containing protein [Bacillus massilionigeriensis]